MSREAASLAVGTDHDCEQKSLFRRRLALVGRDNIGDAPKIIANPAYYVIWKRAVGRREMTYLLGSDADSGLALSKCHGKVPLSRPGGNRYDENAVKNFRLKFIEEINRCRSLWVILGFACIECSFEGGLGIDLIALFTGGVDW